MKKLIALAFLSGTLLLTNCKKVVEEDPEPVGPPTAVIFLPQYSFPNGTKVPFSSTGSKNATSITWDFGDGTTAKTSNPTHTYASPGSYIVKLSVANTEGVKASSIAQITVGTRYVSEFKVTKIPGADATGKPWDDDLSGPDMTMTWKEVSLNKVKADFTQIQPNVNTNGTTLTYTLDPSKEENILDNTNYTLEFYDDDNGTAVLMDKVVVDGKSKTTNEKSPTKITQTLKSTSGGSSGNWEVSISYEIR